MYYLGMIFVDIAAVTAGILIYFSSYKPKVFIKFCDLAEFGVQDPTFYNKQKNPWYCYDRLWRCAVIILAVLGHIYLSYGIADNLIGWVPWVKENEAKVEGGLLSVLTFFIWASTCAFFSRVHELALFEATALDQEQESR